MYKIIYTAAQPSVEKVQIVYVAAEPELGMCTLCWNNFWNQNRMEKESGIMLE